MIRLELIIRLPADRMLPGTACLADFSPGAMWAYAAPCLGRAAQELANIAGNPGRLSTRPSGDTPYGEYQPMAFVQHLPRNERIGEWWLPLVPLSGDALVAHENGRRGLGLHAARGDGMLVPTEGCVRVWDATLGELRGLAAGRVIERIMVERA